MSGVINFVVRQFDDIKTSATHVVNNEPQHTGTMTHTYVNPAVVISNGRSTDLMAFIRHFRYWKWSGTKVVVSPVARAPIDPAHLGTSDQSGARVEAFDMMLFHAYKSNNNMPQTVPMNEPTTGTYNGDSIFLMDQSWRKTSVMKPFSMFIRPKAWDVSYSVPLAGKLSVHEFTPENLHATVDADQRMDDKNRVIMTEEEYPIPSQSSGIVLDRNREAWTYSSDGTGADHYKIRADKNSTMNQDGYERAIVQNHYHFQPLANPIYAGSFLRSHGHVLPSQELAQNLEFYYGSPGQESGFIHDPSNWVRPEEYALTGRRKFVGGWWPTKAWSATDPSQQAYVELGQSMEFPGFFWRVPRHWKTQFTFRVWTFHYFALKSPITHEVYQPYQDGMIIGCARDPKYDGLIWSGIKPTWSLTEQEYLSGESPDEVTDADITPQ